MLTDEQYGRRIGDRLRHEIDDVHASPDLVRELRRRRTKRTWAITGAIAAPVAAAAVVAAAVSVQTTPTRSTTAAPPIASSSARPQIVNVAYVQAETVKALGQGAQYVIYSKDTYESGYYETWTDKATQRYRNDVYTRLPAATQSDRAADRKMTVPSGPPTPPAGPLHRQQSHAVKDLGESQEITTVDWENKWWSVNHLRDSKPQTPIPDPTDPDGMKKAVAEGKVELVGQEKIGAVDTHHLRVIGPQREYKIDLWVDSTTYLPVKETAVKAGNTQGGKEFPESKGEVITYTWLPRTEKNLAELTLTPPTDFKQMK
ncbi:hypothetical protein QRX60_49485 [Amycolatopsis mongoliensis]|uniref:Uncharacterized protein n=1 Tax=Amycolatopsis mongoliensis TaxID=715475 RepID=A0A9Y2JR36_9PSEU|nr:hypothetical protein [Amycolatopsis sp. 4-36]WIY01957.1 hypothetical protein QRX60_49485 [Amycolatopsis sp. 4-36]